ncbi:MAG: septal ring lytic transglycosylase RlpA family protein [Nodosilinea sp.]
MTLLGLIWAVSLPNQHLNVDAGSRFSLSPANPYAVSYSARVGEPPDETQNSSLRSPLSSYYRPRQPGGVSQSLQVKGFKPQFADQPGPMVNWHHWLNTAAVAVVPEAAVSKDVAQDGSAEGPTPCPAYSRYLAPDLMDQAADLFTIQVNDVMIGQVSSKSVADRVASQIRQVIPAIEADPAGLKPRIGASGAAAQLKGRTVFTLPETAAGPGEENDALVATQWVNNLRRAFDAPPLDPSQVQMVAYGLGETPQTFGGTASWYGPYFHGRQTATGETFNQNHLTAAHKSLPFGTFLKVRNLLNGKTVVVRINDRGPYMGERSLDLSYAAAQCLGSEATGVIPYEATVLGPGVPQQWRAEVVTALR